MSGSVPPPDFCALILTRDRPDAQHTARALTQSGYTGPWFLVVEDDDPSLDEYIAQWGDRVVTFAGPDVLAGFDVGDNFNGKGSVIPRNALWGIARNLGYRYFIGLDDDYVDFRWRRDHNLRYINRRNIRDLNRVLTILLDWYKTLPESFVSVALAQGGDFIGGENSSFAQAEITKRKAMNTFILDTERPFMFPGRRNEDVNAYTELQRTGRFCFLTTFQFAIQQVATQTTSGGMTEIYEAEGTYLKTFTSVMRCPSGVKVSTLADRNMNARIHHRVTFNHVAPKAVSADYCRGTPVHPNR